MRYVVSTKIRLRETTDGIYNECVTNRVRYRRYASTLFLTTSTLTIAVFIKIGIVIVLF